MKKIIGIANADDEVGVIALALSLAPADELPTSLEDIKACLPELTDEMALKVAERLKLVTPQEDDEQQTEE